MSEKIIRLNSVQWLNGYNLKLSFDDDTEQEINFEDFILKNQHPDIHKYKDIKLFKEYSITNGDLEWNDYELCFSIEDLYYNKNIESLSVYAA